MDCPKPGPQRADMRFCSRPDYIQLLEAVGTDIVELTGNHNLDWGPQPFLAYTQNVPASVAGRPMVAGPIWKKPNQPLLIEHNGNRLAFLGLQPGRT